MSMAVVIRVEEVRIGRERIMSMCRLESRHLKNQKEFPELCETKVSMAYHLLLLSIDVSSSSPTLCPVPEVTSVPDIKPPNKELYRVLLN